MPISLRRRDLRGKTPPMTFAPASQLPAPGPWTGLMIHSNAPPAAIGATIKRRLAARYPDVIGRSGVSSSRTSF
jgi:hypothetical protein